MKAENKSNEFFEGDQDVDVMLKAGREKESMGIKNKHWFKWYLWKE